MKQKTVNECLVKSCKKKLPTVKTIRREKKITAINGLQRKLLKNVKCKNFQIVKSKPVVKTVRKGHHHHDSVNRKVPEIVDETLKTIENLLKDKVEQVDYERLILSLQSPLPNEYEFPLNACLILSAEETKKLNVIGRKPALLYMLLAHAGFYQDCGLRQLVEETYSGAYGVEFASFWDRVASPKVKQQQLLCECYGLVGMLSEVEKGVLTGMTNRAEDDFKVSVKKCCTGCQINLESTTVDFSPWPCTISETYYSSEKLANRVHRIGEILRNFSFEEENAFVMANNSTLMRFLIVSTDCEYGTLSQIAFDIISNIAKYVRLNVTEEPVLSQLGKSLINLVCSTVINSNDRFKVIRCLEAVQGLIKLCDNWGHMLIALKKQFYQRAFDLLTLRMDIGLVVNCLECILVLTEMTEESRLSVINVHGSINLLTSFLTVDALGNFSTIGNEDVTRSIRLTAALALRNIAEHSFIGRSSLKRWESRLAEIAMSNCESCGVVAQVLSFISEESPATGGLGEDNGAEEKV